MKKIKLNDSSFQFSGESIGDLLDHLQSNKDGIALAVNQEVVPKSQWSKTLLRQGDNVLIFESIAGG
jgi:sulfur carrier protein